MEDMERNGVCVGAGGDVIDEEEKGMVNRRMIVFAEEKKQGCEERIKEANK